MKLSDRLKKIPPYLFAEVDRLIAEKKAQGMDVISFGVGDPDVPTPDNVVETLRAQSLKPENHQYPSYYGLDEYRRSAAAWVERRFGVKFDPDTEVLSLIGSKEGVAHIALALLDPGDAALVPEPSYPVYAMGTLLAGAESYFLPLKAENGFLPDLESVPAEVAARARVLWINYPNNPTGAVAPDGFFKSAIDFAAGNGLVLAHDNAYSEITYDGYVAPSLFQSDGAMELGIEFHSLSKTFNMTGWRVGFACGNARVIEALGTIKTNIDSGIFNPIQLAAVEALENSDVTVMEMVELYRRRRDLLVGELTGLGWDAEPPKGGIYIWMPVPDGFDSVGFSTHVLDRAGVFFTPGNAYGPSGEGYVRLSLTVPDDRILEAVSRLKEVF
jgi:LL-diaminopimelate aminotransferase